jgi:hypothetical protein
MEPNPYTMDPEYKPADMKGKMTGIAKSIFGIYAFNKLRKISGEMGDYDEPLMAVEPIPEPLVRQTVNTYIFYEPGIVQIHEMILELFDRYMEYCPNPDPDVIDRSIDAISLMEYVRGIEETNGTEA